MRALLLLLLTTSLAAQIMPTSRRIASPLQASAAPTTIEWTELTDGTGSSDPQTTASVSPSANASVFVAVSVAASGTQNATASLGVSGCNLTWTEVQEIVVARRVFYVYHGTGASPTTGAITLDYSPSGGSLVELQWSVDQASNTDVSGTPYSNVGTDSATTGRTSASVTVGGSVDSGDHVYFAVTHETDEAVTLEASLTSLSAITGGTDCRTLHAGYDGTPTIDQSPSASWSTSSACAAIACIVEKVP